MLNPAYFSVRPSSELARDRSPSRASSVRGSRLSVSTVNVEPEERPVIETTEELLRVLRASRIDREKIEAVNSYLEHAQENLAGLHQVMHEIMALFVFQASRRVLLTRLTDVYDQAVADQRQVKGGKGVELALDQRVENLAAAVKHADEEVRRLEYWSDVKAMAAEEGQEGRGAGDSEGAVGRSSPPAPPAPHQQTERRCAEGGTARTE
jgi:hypothetical protein